MPNLTLSEAEALAELGNSMGAEVAPQTIELEDLLPALESGRERASALAALALASMPKMVCGSASLIVSRLSRAFPSAGPALYLPDSTPPASGLHAVTVRPNASAIGNSSRSASRLTKL